jgi:hypothetical protein
MAAAAVGPDAPVPPWEDLKFPSRGDDAGAARRLTADMELIAAVLIAGPLGYFVQTRTRVHGIALYLVVWAVIFPIQTAVVHAENPDDIEPMYFIINALILAGGIGLNTLGAGLRERRQSAASA